MVHATCLIIPPQRTAQAFYVRIPLGELANARSELLHQNVSKLLRYLEMTNESVARKISARHQQRTDSGTIQKYHGFFL